MTTSLHDDVSDAAPQPEAPKKKSAKAWKVAVPAVALIAGLMWGVSARASHGTDLRTGSTDLTQVVQGADHRVQVKQQSVAKLRSEVDALQAKEGKSGSEPTKISALNAATKQESVTAGLTAVSGQGVSVSLNDSKLPVSQLPSGGSPDWLVVHQQDVQAVVNALWHGGATSMMLMDQRVVSTSAVRCVGNTLILQGRVYSPPFTITAIGDPDKLKAALNVDPSVIIYKQYVDAVGLGYDLKTLSNITMPAFTGSLTMQHATAIG